LSGTHGLLRRKKREKKEEKRKERRRNVPGKGEENGHVIGPSADVFETLNTSTLGQFVSTGS